MPMSQEEPEYVRFRESEQSLLSAFVTADAECLAPNVFVLGYKSVGKTHVVLRHLENLNIRKTVVSCDEFISQKILLQKCLQGIRNDSGIELGQFHQKYTYKGREATKLLLLCETFAQFLVLLEQFVEETGYDEPHVLVLDRFDQCLDHTDGLLRSFLRFRENSSIRNLSIVYIFSHEEPREVVTSNIPHVRFLPYTSEQVAEILSKNPVQDVVRSAANNSFWAQFAKLVVDLFFDYTGLDISVLQEMCYNLWPKFAAFLDPEIPETPDFVAVYRLLRDEIVKDDVITNTTVAMYDDGLLEEEASVSSLSDLPFHSKFVLIAAYLASYTDQKLDVQLFSRLKTQKKRVNKKSADVAMNKSNVDTRLLLASYFDLERLRAILSVIYRNESSTLLRDNQQYFSMYQELSERDLAKKENEFSTFTLNKNVDLDTQIATLAGLGLLGRTYTKDPLSKKIRWRCNLSWDVIDGIAREVNFPLLSYTVEK